MRWWLAVVLWSVSCGGQPPAVASQEEAAISISRAEDDAALQLEDEGIEDADTLISAALAAHGLSAPDVDLVRGTALRAQLRRISRANPRANANALFAATMKAWEAVAALPPKDCVRAIAALAGFDPSAAPVAISAETARAAAEQPEAGLDPHSRNLLASARAAVIAAIGQHVDLSPAAATARAGPIDLAAHSLARKAALAFAGLPAAGERDPSMAAARALRFTWQRYQDHGHLDEAWPQVAFALGIELPQPARSARPDVEVDGPACAPSFFGIECQGGGAVTVRVDGISFAASGKTRGALASALLDALPPGFAGCITGPGLLRIDRAAAKFEVAVGQGALTVRGSYPLPGSRPQVVMGFVGNELRLLVRPSPDASAPASFTETVPIPRRLPHRRYEVEVEDADGALLAAATLDAR